MKHFLDKDIKLSDKELEAIWLKARTRLQKKPMSIDQMKNIRQIISFNSNGQTSVISEAFSRRVNSITMDVEASVTDSFIKKTHAKIKKSEIEILAFILENIQNKSVKCYLDLVFGLKLEQEYSAKVVVHFSKKDLIKYLAEFIDQSTVDNISREVRVFRIGDDTPWKTFKDSSALLEVETAPAKSAIIYKPFFSELKLILPQKDSEEIIDLPLGKLRSVQRIFNRRKKASTGLHQLNSLFLSKEDIAGFKFATAQDTLFHGVSLNKEFIKSTEFITKNLGLDFNTLDQVDYFKIGKGKSAADIEAKSISEFEFNLDSQQLIIKTEIDPEKFHINNFFRIQLVKGEETADIDKIVYFDSQESATESLQNYFATEYSFQNMATKLKTAELEKRIIFNQSIVTGDILTQLFMSNLNLMRIFPKEVACIGYSAEDMNNPQKMIEDWKKKVDDSKDRYRKILNVENAPNAIQKKFSQLKNIWKFLQIKKFEEITSSEVTLLVEELEDLLIYMDDFLRLDIYKTWDKKLEADQEAGIEELEGQDDASEDDDKKSFDKETTDFIGKNYRFFEKRELIQDSIINCEDLLIFFKHILPYYSKPDFNPDLVLFSNSKSVRDNFKNLSYPAVSLHRVFKNDLFNEEDYKENLYFIQFMRGFANKVFESAKKLNRSVIHQYKHTLTELDYIFQEKKKQLEKELIILEDPENREEAYKIVHKQVTEMYYKRLSDKEKQIETLKAELAEIDQKIEKLFIELLAETGAKIEIKDIISYLRTIPKLMEEIRKEAFRDNDLKKNKILPLINAQGKFHNHINIYYSKVINYSSLFYKAQLVQLEIVKLKELKTEVKEYLKQSPEKLESSLGQLLKKEKEIISRGIDKTKVTDTQKKIKNYILDLRKLPIKRLFRDLEQHSITMSDYFNYFKDQSGLVFDILKKHNEVNSKLKIEESNFFKKQREIANVNSEIFKIRLAVKLIKVIKANPTPEEEIDLLLQRTESVPPEIKEELGMLRQKVNESWLFYQKLSENQGLNGLADYTLILEKIDKRARINEIYKELVNLVEGKRGVQEEVKFEQEDLAFLQTQEENLDKVVMSKSLPSTRTLIKTQYIPQIEREMKLLKKANEFFGNIISNSDNLFIHLRDAFFRRRYGIQQFLTGFYCIDTSQTTRNITSKNVYTAYKKLAAKYSDCCSVATENDKPALKAIDIYNLNGLKNWVQSNWEGREKTKGSFIYLPCSLKLKEVLELCKFKDELVKKQPQLNKSKHSLILIYVNAMNYNEVENNSELLNSFNLAVKSNILINVDSKQVYNNSDSIFEACLKETFGMTNDPLGSKIISNFMLS